MTPFFTLKTVRGKQLFAFVAVALSLLVIACTVNPATGQKEFTALLPAGQEASVGASEHAKVQQTYGDFVTGPVADYVSRVGQKLAANTERTDVQYKFYVIDSPIINAFALPGGYVYVSRGILALANSEAELAGVLAHEIGHITARHAASRMSQGALAGLGAAILSAATGSDAVGQIANVGSDLYIKSYSRGQETQSDELGIRYLSAAGYDPMAMSSFLNSMEAQSVLEQKISGKQAQSTFNYFSTHPLTSDRITHAAAIGKNYPQGAKTDNRDVYLSMLNGLTYGDSEAQGFVRGENFYHTKMGFTFSVPKGFTIQNSPSEVLAVHSSGAAIILDSGRDDQSRDPLAYLTQNWMKANPPSNAESITINGLRAATAAFAGTANGKPVTIRVVAIEWKPGQFFRFQMAIPQNAGTDVVEGMKRTTYSFRAMTQDERNSIRPLKIRIVTASAVDSAATLSQRMAFSSYKEERFRVLNALQGNVTPGQVYKIVTE